LLSRLLLECKAALNASSERIRNADLKAKTTKHPLPQDRWCAGGGWLD
jgi:hypothetical protein